MKKTVAMLRITALVIAMTLFSYASQLHAQTAATTSSNVAKTMTAQQAPANQPLNIHLNNPLKVNTITDAIKLLASVVIRIALPLIIIFFIWSGFSFILARGKPEEVAKARRMFFYTVIGTLLILGAWTITNAIVGTINAIVS